MSDAPSQPPVADAPRRGDSRKFIWRLMIFFGVFFLLLGVQESFYQEAVRLRGVVIEKIYTPGTSRVGPGTLGTNSRYEIRYRFTTPRGETREDSTDVLPETWNGLREGDGVDLEYLPQTQDSRLAGQTAPPYVWFILALALIGGGIWVRRGRRSER